MGRSRREKLKNAIFRYVEAELRDYPQTKKDYEELRIDIIEAGPEWDDVGGNSIHQTNRISDPTHAKANKLTTNRRLAQMEKTIKAIEKTMRILNYEKQRYMQLRYFDGRFTPVGVASELHISDRTSRRWRREIVGMIAEDLGFLNATEI